MKLSYVNIMCGILANPFVIVQGAATMNHHIRGSKIEDPFDNHEHRSLQQQPRANFVSLFSKFGGFQLCTRDDNGELDQYLLGITNTRNDCAGGCISHGRDEGLLGIRHDRTTNACTCLYELGEGPEQNVNIPVSTTPSITSTYYCLAYNPIPEFEYFGNGNCLDVNGENYDFAFLHDVPNAHVCGTTCLANADTRNNLVGMSHYSPDGRGRCFCLYEDGTLPTENAFDTTTSTSIALHPQFSGTGPVSQVYSGNSGSLCFAYSERERLTVTAEIDPNDP